MHVDHKWQWHSACVHCLPPLQQYKTKLSNLGMFWKRNGSISIERFCTVSQRSTNEVIYDCSMQTERQSDVNRTAMFTYTTIFVRFLYSQWMKRFTIFVCKRNGNFLSAKYCSWSTRVHCFRCWSSHRKPNYCWNGLDTYTWVNVRNSATTLWWVSQI